MSFVCDLDTPLLKLSARDNFTLRQAFEGVHIFGQTGGGKTSGSGKTLAGAFLRAGMGGLWLCVKPEEVDYAKALAKAHGRESSVVVFDEAQGFNFITYEIERQGLDGLSNVTECLMRVLAAADQAVGSGGSNSSDPFWEQAIRQILNHAIPLIYSAHGQVSVGSIFDFVNSAAARDGKQYLDEKWQATSYAAQTIHRAAKAPTVALPDARLRALADFWFTQYPAIPQKTQGGIVISLSAKLDRFKHGRLQRAFCDRTTIVPEMTFHGAIIILAMPILTWNDDGIIAQHLFKYIWQNAVEGRNGLSAVHRERPVFLWCDESQYVVHPKDDLFLSTCRASRACVVFLSQTLPSYYARLGNDKREAVNGLIGKFATQIFHQNACTQTNSFASSLIGRGIVQRNNFGRSGGRSRSTGLNQGAGSSSQWGSGSGSSSGQQPSQNWNRSSGSGRNASWGQNVGTSDNEGWSSGTSEQMDSLVEPNFFSTGLKAGGKPNRGKVTAVWFRAGANFNGGGSSYMLATFQQ